MDLHRIKDRSKLANYFRLDLPAHAYSLGDLDDLFWPRTVCYGEIQGETISRVCTLYQGEGLPVLLMFGSDGTFQEDSYEALYPHLPDSFYAHFSPGLEKLFADDYEVRSYGDHQKMSLVNTQALDDLDSESAILLTPNHLPELLAFYQQSYPENAFDPLMLETGKYYGCRSGDTLVSAAGIHVYSSHYRVATLGNITTHPNHRNQGYARLVTSALCQDLLGEVDYIGLNVKSDNLPAILLYQSLGFKTALNYGEFGLKKRF